MIGGSQVIVGVGALTAEAALTDLRDNGSSFPELPGGMTGRMCGAAVITLLPDPHCEGCDLLPKTGESRIGKEGHVGHGTRRTVDGPRNTHWGMK